MTKEEIQKKLEELEASHAKAVDDYNLASATVHNLDSALLNAKKLADSSFKQSNELYKELCTYRTVLEHI